MVAVVVGDGDGRRSAGLTEESGGHSSRVKYRVMRKKP